MAKKRYYSRPKIEIVTMDVDKLMQVSNPRSWTPDGGLTDLPIISGNPTNPPSDPYGGDESAKGGSVWDIWE